MQAGFIADAISTVSPTSLAIAMATFVITTVAYVTLKDRNLPPGPIGLPYIGYWPFMDMNCHLKLDAWKKKHGDIISFTSTGRLFINLGSIKAVREAFVTKAEFFGDRISGFNIMTYILKDGVSGINGEHWKVVRKFFSVILKERGVNALKTGVAGSVYDSLMTTINELKAKNGEPINVIELTFKKCTAFLRLTLFGEVGMTDEQIDKFIEFYKVEMWSFTPTNMLLCGNLAKYFILPFTPNYSKAIESHKKMLKLLYDVINQHKATYDAENPRDIIDEYFKERDKRRSRGDPTAEYFSEETTLGRYRIPKGAIMMPNFYSCHHDPEMYDEPERFNPSRFIQKEGKRRPELPILFGVGKRSCLGESYVMMQIFLLLATLIQNFELSLPGGPREISVVEFFTDSLLISAKPR